MATIEQQLTQLVQDKSDLVDNLTTKGIEGLTGDETFTELVPEVLNIPSGGEVDTADYMRIIDLAEKYSTNWLRNYTERDYNEKDVNEVNNLIKSMGGNL